MTEAVLFWLFAVVAVAGGLGVVLARDPLHGALSLLAAFFALAGLFLLLAAQLLAVLQVLVYAGAILVLFLLVILLLDLGPARAAASPPGVVKLAGALGALGLAGLLCTLFLSASFPPAVPPSDFGAVAAVGRVLFIDYTLPFEAISLLLLAAILGAVVVAKGKV